VTHTRNHKASAIDPEFLLQAYRQGFFPMADSASGEIRWYSPDTRGVFDLDMFHVPRSLASTVRKKLYDLTIDRSFERVIRACAKRDETWISEEIVQSYLELHRRGYAHSVEAWSGGHLVGGLYGVALGGAFFGESMFSRQRDASKVALVFLVERLKQQGFTLLDTQWLTPHLAQFGAQEISRGEYLTRLERAVHQSVQFT
jgi:leucyl/phenylalanyl-tRNA--protein transferase